MATLKEWFETKDYETGLIILSRCSKNKILIVNLTKRNNPAKLEYELSKIARHRDIKLAPVLTIDKGPLSHSDQMIDVVNKDREKRIVESVGLKVIRNKHEVNYEDLPEEFQMLWDVNRDAAKEIRALHEKLKLMEKASPEDREPLTMRITQLDEILHSNWEIINKWEPGKVSDNEPGTEPAAPVKTDIDHKRINANRKYISVGLKMLKSDLTQEKSEKIKAEILVRYNELISSGEDVTIDTIEQLKKEGINI
jgi:hypothetical protein